MSAAASGHLKNSTSHSSLTKVSSLWKSAASSTPNVLATLPIAALEMPVVSSVDGVKLRERFASTLQAIKKSLLEAKRAAVLSRSRSTVEAQRFKFSEAANQHFTEAKKHLQDLHSIARGLDLAARRKARAVEGSPEWRNIHHSIRKGETTISHKKGIAA